MAKPLSRDLRLRIIRAVEDEGMSCRGAAGRFGVAPSTAIELVSEWRSTGTCEAEAQGGDRRSARIEGHAAEILSLVEATPDMTLAEIADHLFKVHGERFAPSVVWRFFDRRNITFKKTLHASEQGRPSSLMSARPSSRWMTSSPPTMPIIGALFAGLIATMFGGNQILITTHDERSFNYLKDQLEAKAWHFTRIIGPDPAYGSLTTK